MNDLDLLRRFEPVIYYTQGEHFFPTNVDRYIRDCSLWETRPDQPATRLIAEGELTPQKLIEPRTAPHGTVQYLRYVEQLTPLEAAKFLARHQRKFHRSRGRLARVGLASRIVDALFSITLFLRGRVPGGTAAAAAAIYEEAQAEKEEYVYYARLVRQNGYICLHYFYFYAMNDWRSSFYGVNDHESDWEQVIVYLTEDFTPQWVAYASHDFSGDDLRRRWDDTELKRDGDHPIIFAGAGSHASYFSAGEYMHEVELPFSGPVTRVWRAMQKFWRDTLRQGQLVEEEQKRSSGVLVVPFVDYARGDGMQIGHGREKIWQARLLPDVYDTSPDHPQSWAHHYRGLWGLYARDPIAGENAPAGPKYNRNGSVRGSWIDPVRWAGLDKVTPPLAAEASIQKRIDEIRARQQKAQAEIESKTLELRGMGLEAESMFDVPYFKPIYSTHIKKVDELSDEIAELQKQIAIDHSLLESLDAYSDRLARGVRLPVRGHLKAAHHPTSETTEQLGRLAEAWAAISLGLLILGLVLVLLIAPQLWANGIVSVVSAISFLEALFRREAKVLIQRAVSILGIVATLVLIYEFALPLLVLGIIALGIFIMVDNLRELAG